MKYQRILLSACTVAFCLMAGCSKTEESAPAPAAVEPPKPPEPPVAATPAPKPAEPAVATVVQQANEQAAAAQKAVQPAAAAVQEQAAAITSKAQSLIDQIRKQIADGKWSDALKSLGEVSALKLTPEQQATVDSLKQQAQTMAQQAATSSAVDKGSKALGDMLKKK